MTRAVSDDGSSEVSGPLSSNGELHGEAADSHAIARIEGGEAMQLSRGELVVMEDEAGKQRSCRAAGTQQADSVDIREEAVQAVANRQQRSEKVVGASASHADSRESQSERESVEMWRTRSDDRQQMCAAAEQRCCGSRGDGRCAPGLLLLHGPLLAFDVGASDGVACYPMLLKRVGDEELSDRTTGGTAQQDPMPALAYLSNCSRTPHCLRERVVQLLAGRVARSRWQRAASVSASGSQSPISVETTRLPRGWRD
jgi:hypothetical protein